MASFITPLFRATTAALSNGSVEEVDCTINGRPCNYVAITPSQQPPTGNPHTVGVNLAAPVFDMDAATTWEFAFPPNTPTELRAHSVHVTSGLDGTTFEVIGHV